MGPRLIGAASNWDNVVTKLGNVADRAGSATLKYSGFDLVERWNRVWAGSTGLLMFRDVMSKAIGDVSKGAYLRGKSLERARRQMEKMGINLDDVVKKARAGHYLRKGGEQEWMELERTAVFGLAQYTQFIPSPLRRPVAWDHPYGRVIFQFKTFALGQGRFIRDQVFAEAARGNMTPMAYFLSIYPIAGELVGDAKAVLRGKDRPDNFVERMMSNYTMVGGMGIASDAFQALRFGRGLDWVMGPTVGDFATFGEAMATAPVDKTLKMVQRQPIYTAVRNLMALPVLGMAGISAYLDTLNKQEPGEDLVDISDVMFEATQQKRNR